MATARPDTDQSNEVLVVTNEPTLGSGIMSFCLIFTQLLDLLKHISNNVNRAITFQLIIPVELVGELLRVLTPYLPSISNIYVYYDHEASMERVRHAHRALSGVLKFVRLDHLARCVNALQMSAHLSERQSINRALIRALVLSTTERICRKRSRRSTADESAPKRSRISPSHTRRLTSNEAELTCGSCGSVYCELYQLECGHRHCRSCLSIR